MTSHAITPADLDRQLKNGRIELIDVRTPIEYRELHVRGARNVPLDRLDPQQFGRDSTEGSQQPIALICRTGGRGKQACDKLAAAGLRVVNVEGGTLACVEAGLDVLHGQKAISLERQVRIAAGSLVFLGAMLALAVHPYFAALSAFVGAGLVFAGVTDTCGMAMVLARMPWNHVRDEPACCFTNG